MSNQFKEVEATSGTGKHYVKVVLVIASIIVVIALVLTGYLVFKDKASDYIADQEAGRDKAVSICGDGTCDGTDLERIYCVKDCGGEG